MAITQTFTVGFALTVGFKTEDYAMIGKAREELHKAVEKQGLDVILAQRKKREHHAIKAMMDPEVTNEEIFVMSVKEAVRQHVEEFAEDDKQGTFIRVGDISTKVRHVVEKVGMWCSECQNCVTQPCGDQCGLEVK